MIITSLSDSRKYETLHPLFAKAFQYLRDTNFAVLPLGKHEILKSDLFAIVSEYNGKNILEAKPEAHKEYIDIQYIIEGEEHILWMPLEEAKEIELEYDESSDIMFYKDIPLCDVALLPNHLAILFPDDIHAPTISNGKVRKVILKIRTQ